MNELTGNHSGRRVSWRMIGWGAAVSLVLLPLIAMQVTDEVPWTFSDFVFAAVFIGGTGLLFELVVRASSDLFYRLGFAVTLIGAFLLVWANAAAGIIGSADNDANFLYGLVLLVGLLTGAVGRFRPAAMVRATGMAALVQAAITVFAVTAGLARPESPALELWAINGFFIVFWLGAALLFRKAVAGASVGEQQ